jgi:hypothetical protein
MVARSRLFTKKKVIVMDQNHAPLVKKDRRVYVGMGGMGGLGGGVGL